MIEDNTSSVPLAFPTLAEKAIANWKAMPGTVAFESVALPLGARREDAPWPATAIEWVFPDDTTVTIAGRGKNYKIESHLP